MNLKEISILIEKYKKGECSQREKEFLENYLESFQNNPGEWNENEMGSRRIIEEEIYSGIMKNISGKKKHNLSEKFFTPLLLKQAAAVIFLIALASGILYLSGIFIQNSNQVAWKENITLPGEKSTITLPDGSNVTLNADSRLRYPKQFNGKTRDIYLTGEAYFEVNHNISRPFIVHTEDLTTTDLGTKFDVSAFPDNKTISVFLLEGKVKVSMPEKGKIDKVTFLNPKEQLLYDKVSNASKLGIFDSIEAIGWMDKIYKFDNETLSEVLPKLERAYGVKFEFTDKQFLTKKVTAKFNNSSLQTVIEVIKNLTGLDYKIVKETGGEKEIKFFKNN